eukprot:CAMPEP_0198678952 /NCGR_PEP_ID=MMETSP1468-20131203/1812_1 /TAXON_ID=1461545 /ORGANISM="Mantoniella sp, Strain CCMP1436" /LENGTH=93 /DNA_ID=CAMNT_0044417007 /DNA_START=334 /DNA_END=612 /DNA_ORIENTATION=+
MPLDPRLLYRSDVKYVSLSCLCRAATIAAFPPRMAILSAVTPSSLMTFHCICPRLQKRLNHRQMSTMHSQLQWRRPGFKRLIGVRTRLQKHLH